MLTNISLWLTGLITIIITLIKIYQKFSCGICKSSAHMVNKVVIVTGANGSIGFETAKDLAERGAKVILACRNEKRGKAARDKIINTTGNKEVIYRHLDLSSFKSIKQFVEETLKSEKEVNVIINNAAISGIGYRKTEDGLNLGMQVNYYGPFLLTGLLIPILKASKPSRIVNVSSFLHYFGEIDFDNLNMERYWSDCLVYSNSKLFLNLMTLELSKQLKGSGVTVNALHPGVAATNIFNDIPYDVIRNFLRNVYKYMFKGAWEAAQTSIHLAVSPEVKDISGRYFADCMEVKPSSKSLDENLAKKLWIASERLVNFRLDDKV